MTNIWVPPSYRDRGLVEARRAVKDYDSELEFGLNEQTGQWCVFIPQGTNGVTMERDLPVLGFNHIPTRDEVQKRLYESDARRRGYEILDAIQRHNDQLHAEQAKISDADREVAEKFAWGFKKMGSEKAPTQVYMPGDKTEDV